MFFHEHLSNTFKKSEWIRYDMIRYEQITPPHISIYHL